MADDGSPAPDPGAPAARPAIEALIETLKAVRVEHGCVDLRGASAVGIYYPDNRCDLCMAADEALRAGADDRAPTRSTCPTCGGDDPESGEIEVQDRRIEDGGSIYAPCDDPFHAAAALDAAPSPPLELRLRDALIWMVSAMNALEAGYPRCSRGSFYDLTVQHLADQFERMKQTHSTAGAAGTVPPTEKAEEQKE